LRLQDLNLPNTTLIHTGMPERHSIHQHRFGYKHTAKEIINHGGTETQRKIIRRNGEI